MADPELLEPPEELELPEDEEPELPEFPEELEVFVLFVLAAASALQRFSFRSSFRLFPGFFCLTSCLFFFGFL